MCSCTLGFQRLNHDTPQHGRLLSQSQDAVPSQHSKNNINYTTYPSQPAHSVTTHPVWHNCHIYSLIHLFTPHSSVMLHRPLNHDNLETVVVRVSGWQSVHHGQGFLQIDDFVVASTTHAFGEHFQRLVEIPVNLLLDLLRSDMFKISMQQCQNLHIFPRLLVQIEDLLLPSLFVLYVLPKLLFIQAYSSRTHHKSSEIILPSVSHVDQFSSKTKLTAIRIMTSIEPNAD